MKNWQSDKVAVRIAPGLDDEPDVVPAGVNGVMYDIPRGVNVLVPRSVAIRLEKCQQDQYVMPAQRPEQGPVYIGRTPRFAIYPVSEAMIAREGVIDLRPRPPLHGRGRVNVPSQFQLPAAVKLTSEQAEQRAAESEGYAQE